MGDVMGLIIGSHVSFKNDTGLVGSVEEALRYGANTFMFYTGAPQNTRRGNIDMDTVNEAYSLMKENGIDKDNVVVHAPYIVNLCNDLKFDFSVSFLHNFTLAFTFSPSSITLRFVRCNTSSTDFFRKRVLPILLSCRVLEKMRKDLESLNDMFKVKAGSNRDKRKK